VRAAGPRAGRAPAAGAARPGGRGAPVVRVERRGACAWVILDRPPLNLIVPEMIEGLIAAFAALARDAGVGACVLTGHGRATTAGMQIQFLRDLTVRQAKAFIATLHDAIRAVHEAPFPTVCMMNGACLGGGFELAMACDMRTAAADALMGLPEIRVGVPSVIEAALLPRLIGPGRAAEYLLTGANITAAQALEWGLVNRVAPRAELERATTELIDRVLEGAPGAVRLQKELIVRWRNTDLRTAVEYGINAFAQSYATSEPREAMTAFLEKRRPRYDRLT
jgi:enoyl-CoA hydratase/carnithine racemase